MNTTKITITLWWYYWRQLCLILCLIETSSDHPWKSSGNFGNLREIRQKLRYWYAYKLNKIIHDAWIFLLVFNSILKISLLSLVWSRVKHLQRNFISPRTHAPMHCIIFDDECSTRRVLQESTHLEKSWQIHHRQLIKCVAKTKRN